MFLHLKFFIQFFIIFFIYFFKTNKKKHDGEKKKHIKSLTERIEEGQEHPKIEKHLQ
tara:strand:- start:45 stop:215 length:171 start_codon:yes stop_codon:yes gene_type:complete